MSKMCTVRQLINPTDSELEQAAKLSCAAFAKDQFAAVVTRHDPELLYQFFKYQLLAGKLGGEIYVAEDTTKTMVGVGVWFGPGRVMFDDEEQHETALMPLLAKFDPELRKYWAEDFLPQYDSLTTDALGEGTKLAAWHLQHLAVLPEFQGMGVGKAIIQTMQQKVAGTGKFLCLETETELNLAIYGRLGFKSMGDQQFQSPYGEFHMWSMLLTPASEA